MMIAVGVLVSSNKICVVMARKKEKIEPEHILVVIVEGDADESIIDRLMKFYKNYHVSFEINQILPYLSSFVLVNLKID